MEQIAPERKAPKIKKILIIAGICVSILLLLIFTRPDRDHFRDWLNYQLNKPSSDFLNSTLKKSVRRQANYHISYSNKFLFAIAETRAGNRKLKFIGLFHTWLPLP